MPRDIIRPSEETQSQVVDTALGDHPLLACNVCGHSPMTGTPYCLKSP